MRMQKASAAMSALGSKSQLCAMGGRSPPDQFFNSLRSLFDQNLDRGRIAQPVAGLDRVLQMQSDLVFVAEDRCDPPHFTMRSRSLRQDEHTSRIG